MNSTEIAKAMKEWCKKRNIMIERCNAGKIKIGRGWMYLMSAGHPDMQLYLSAWKILFIEIKTWKDVLRTDQELYHEQLVLRWHDVRTIYSFEEFTEIMLRLGYY